ncbi:MAG: alpha/beta hydrolase [Sandaracinaceae bacterium]
MKTRQLGPLTVRIAGGPDREGGGDGPVICLLHGFGASGEDLVPLHRVFRVAPDVRWVFPAAPLELPPMMPGMESRAWWMIDMAAVEQAMRTGRHRDLAGEVPEGLAEARRLLLETLEAMDDVLHPSRLVLGGFSQGAMLSLDVALHTERALAGLVQLSGTLVAKDLWAPRVESRAGLPVFQSHGQLDPLLPFAGAEMLRDLLAAGGLDVEFTPFRGAHEIPPPVLEGLAGFLSRVLPDG